MANHLNARRVVVVRHPKALSGNHATQIKNLSDANMKVILLAPGNAFYDLREDYQPPDNVVFINIDYFDEGQLERARRSFSRALEDCGFLLTDTSLPYLLEGTVVVRPENVDMLTLGSPEDMVQADLEKVSFSDMDWYDDFGT